MSGSLYWTAVWLLIAVGLATGFSIGLPLLLLGATLAVLSSFRDRPRVFWPWLLGVVGFIGGYLLIAPLGCSAGAITRSEPRPPESRPTARASVVCSSVLGLPYSGPASYEPPMWPAFLGGFGVAFAVAGATRLALTNRTRPALPPERHDEGGISDGGTTQ